MLQYYYHVHDAKVSKIGCVYESK